MTEQQATAYAGQTITCTACQKPFTLPESGPAPSNIASAPRGRPAVPPTPATPPVPPSAPAQPPLSYATPAYGPQKASGLTITALVFGILACTIGLVIPIILALPAIILGAIGLSRTRDPNVGGRGFAIAGLTMGIVGMLLSTCAFLPWILLPSLNRARETANRVKCASNMRQIGQGMLLYANENGGNYPPDLGTILTTQSLGAEVLVCPSTTDTRAPGATPAQQAASLSQGKHVSYIYVGAGLHTAESGPDTVLLYEPLANHRNDGINILWGDGHVSFMTRLQAQKILTELQQGYNPPRPEKIR